MVSHTNRPENLKAIQAEISWVILGQVVVFIAGIASVKCLTSYMGPVAYGQWALGMTIAGILNLFVYGPISQTALRFFSICRDCGKFGLYIKLLRKTHIKAFFTVFFIMAVLSLALMLSGWGQQWAVLVPIAILFGVISGINGTFISIYNADRQRKHVAFYQALDACLRPAFAILVLFAAGNHGYSALLGFALGTLFVATSQWRTFKAHPPTQYKNESYSYSEIIHLQSRMRQYAVPFLYFSLAGVVSMYGDRWILQGVFGEREVGIYAAMYQIANAPLAVVLAILSQFAIPIVFDRSDDASLFRAVAVMSILYLIIVGVYFMLGDSILHLFTSDDFVEAHDVLWLIALGIGLFNLGQLIVVKGLRKNRPSVYIWPKFFQATSFLAFSYIFVQEWGIRGMAYSVCLSSLMYVLSVAFVNMRLDRKEEDG